MIWISRKAAYYFKAFYNNSQSHMQAFKMAQAAGEDRQSEQNRASHNIMNDFSDSNDQSPILP